MENELIYIEIFTVIKNQNIFHRDNEAEWKYVGTWGDLLDDKSKHLIEKTFPENKLEKLFIAIGHYATTLEIIKQNLINRNNDILQEISKKK